MDQTNIQPAKPAVSKWLLIVGLIVVLAAAGFFIWNYSQKSDDSGANLAVTTPKPTASLTPTPILTISPVTTPVNTPSPIPTPTPRQWKTETSSPVSGGLSVGFSIKIDPSWSRFIQDDTAHGIVYFTDSSECEAKSQLLDTFSNECFGDIAIGLTAEKHNAMQDHNMVIREWQFTSETSGEKIPIYVGVNRSISEADQNTIFESFKQISS